MDKFNDTKGIVCGCSFFLGCLFIGTRLQPYELALLLRESGGEGVEFFEGRHKQLRVRRDQPVPLVVEVASGSKDKLHAFLFARHPDAPDSPMHGHLVEGRPCWFINFDGGLIFPFADVFDEDILNNVFSINNVVEWPRARMPEFIHSVLGRIKVCPMAGQGPLSISFRGSLSGRSIVSDGSIKRLTIDVRFIYNGQARAAGFDLCRRLSVIVDGHTLGSNAIAGAAGDRLFMRRMRFLSGRR